MKPIRLLATMAAAAIALSACGGHSGGVVPSTTGSSISQPTTTTPGSGAMSNFAFGGKLLQQSTLLNPIDKGALSVQVMVSMSNAHALLQYAQDVNNPKSANYHQFLAPAQIASRFGASQSNYNAVTKYFAKYGLHVGGWPQRETITVSGPIEKFSKAFGVKFGVYQHGKEQFIGPVGTPSVAMNVPISAVSGLIGAHLNARQFTLPSNATASGNTPQQMARAFDFSGAYANKIDGTGVNVAIVGTGPIMADDAKQYGSMFNARMANITEVDVNDTDLCAALTQQGDTACVSPTPSPTPGTTPTPAPTMAPTPPYTPNPQPTASGVPSFEDAYPNVGWTSPPAVTNPDTNPYGNCSVTENPGMNPAYCNSEDVEAQLDTQTIASLAPGSNVLFYYGYWTTGNECPNSSYWWQYCGYTLAGLQATDAEIQEIIAQNQADVVSLSYGLGEEEGVGYYFDSAGQGFEPLEFATMAAEGMAVFASSGDSGQYNCNWYYGQFCASYPASDPNVTAVGGVTAPLNPNGTFKQEVTAWGDQTFGSNAVGSGGGVSQIFTEPQWQKDANIPFANGMRAVPDVALMGDPASGTTVVTNADFGNSGNGIFDVGGTSLAAPQMAAMWALVLQSCAADAVCSAKYATTTASGSRVRMGNAAPYLYKVYENSSQNASTLFDVIYGSVTYNQYCQPANCQTPPPSANAMTGWDEMTGVGVPFAGHLINAVVTNAGGTNPNLP